MQIGAEFAVGGDALHGLLFEHHARIVGEIGEDFAATDHEAAVDEAAFGLRLFVEAFDRVVLAQGQFAESPRRMHGGNGADFLRGLVLPDDGGDVDVADAVAVGEKKGVVIAEVFLDLADAGGGHGLLAGVGEGDGPVFLAMVRVKFHGGLGAEAQRGVARVPQVIAEVVLDHLALVAQAEDEVLEPVVRVNLHDVPQHGPVADGDHRLGTILGFFAQPRALAAAEDDSFHSWLSSLRFVAVRAVAGFSEPGWAGIVEAAGCRRHFGTIFIREAAECD